MASTSEWLSTKGLNTPACFNKRQDAWVIPNQETLTMVESLCAVAVAVHRSSSGGISGQLLQLLGVGRSESACLQP
jgi:hypothetical protein